MMMPEKKKISSLIVSKLSGADSKMDFIDKQVPEEKSSEPSYSAEEAAMSTFLRAFKREDVKGMCAALKDFFYLCESGEDESMGDSIFSRE